MLNGLKLWNFAAETALPDGLCPSSFVLATCQRTMVLTFNRYPFANNDLPDHELHSAEAAYLFLLETICGLKSKLIGENEIVGQFKEAYKLYAASTLKDTKLLTILEKLFQDAKDIRTQHLIGISQKTYASLTRKHLIQKAKADHILILGSGQLAEDLINQFKKKAKITICARNEARVSLLAASHDIEILPWEKRQEMVSMPFIANTIGCSKTIWNESFFSSWKQNNPEGMFVDLGSPAAIETTLTKSSGVVRLSDVFEEGAIVEGQKQRQIDEARAAMLLITHKRKSLLEAKLTRTPSVLAPQSLKDAVYL